MTSYEHNNELLWGRLQLDDEFLDSAPWN